MEGGLLRSLEMSHGDFAIFLERPICAGCRSGGAGESLRREVLGHHQRANPSAPRQEEATGGDDLLPELAAQRACPLLAGAHRREVHGQPVVSALTNRRRRPANRPSESRRSARRRGSASARAPPPPEGQCDMQAESAATGWLLRAPRQIAPCRSTAVKVRRRRGKRSRPRPPRRCAATAARRACGQDDAVRFVALAAHLPGGDARGAETREERHGDAGAGTALAAPRPQELGLACLLPARCGGVMRRVAGLRPGRAREQAQRAEHRRGGRPQGGAPRRQASKNSFSVTPRLATVAAGTPNVQHNLAEVQQPGRMMGTSGCGDSQ
jgi:hypothetical protein